MAKFEIQTPDGRFEVTAPDMETAIRALNGGGQESPESVEGRGQLSRLTQRASDGSNELGATRAGAENFADMTTFGLADEAAAGLGALGGMLPGGHGRGYGSIKREIAAQRTQNDAAHPLAAAGGMVGGALASGISLTKSGLSLLARLGPKASLGAKVGAGAAEGAAYGGAYGFGSGEGAGDRLSGAAGGAVAGGLIGGTLPALVAGTKAVAKPITDAVRARTNPGGYAGEKVAERLSASNMTPETVARKMAANPGSSVADVGGKSTRDLLRTTVNVPGPAKDRVAKQVTLRQFGQGDRLKAAVSRTFADPDGYLSAKDELADAAKKIATPLYERAYARPVHFSEGLEEILNTPAGKSALAHAQQLAANEQQPFRHVFVNIRGEAKRVPDTRGWDYIKRSLDDMIEGQKDSITGKVTNEGRILNNLKNRMLSEIDQFNPDYKAARQAYGGIAQVEEALEFGRKAAGMSPEAIKREMAKMSPTQKEAARIGRAENLRALIDKSGFTNNAILKIFNSRQNLDGLRAMFDSPTQFAEFRKTIFQEARKRATYDAVKGNSTTASQLADMFESGGSSETANLAGKLVQSGPISGTIQWVGSNLRRLGGLTPKVADEIAQRLMSTSPQQTRQLVAEMAKIQAAQVSAAQKSQMIQSLISKQLTIPAVNAVGQN